MRLIPVKDVVEPRAKLGGSGGAFPGLTGPVETVGSGSTRVLRGAAVVTVGQLVGFQEGIIDMDGPGAEYTPFSQTFNLVLVAEPQKGVDTREYEAALRLAGCRAAEYLAAAAEAPPERVEVYQTLPLPEQILRHPGLPRVVYLYLLQSQGLLHDTYLYGVDVKQLLPTFIYPTEVMDGAVVSGNCVSACNKNTTYHHQNNPVIEELYQQDGKTLNFLGVVCSNENVTLKEKERSSWFATKLIGFLGAEGVIVSKEGFGNPDTDMVMNFRRLRQQGIKTVLITDEFAGQDGASPSLADADSQAEAVVSTGNANQKIVLPPLERVISDLREAERLAGGWAGSIDPAGGLQVELQSLVGATNELGYGRLGARGY